MNQPSSSGLDALVGQHISHICGCSYYNDNDNHCAHFVCHVTGLNFGATCFGITGKGSHATSANIRVHEVFARCRRVGVWSNKPADITSGFIFVTQAGNVNVATKVMANVRRKHIGIFIGNDVWQYKNARTQVIKQTPADFLRHYTGTGYQIYYGEFPL